MRELWRRLFLVAGVSIAVCLWFLTDLSPRVTVASVDFAKEQKQQTHFMGFVSETRRYLASLPLETYIQKMVTDYEVEGSPKWKAFVARADRDLGNPKPGEKRKYVWLKPTLWFKLRAPPFNRLAPRFVSSPLHALYLPYEKNGKPSYLRFQLHTYKSDNFGLGTGYRGSTPPTRLFYPLRAWAWLPALLGLLGYLLLPWPGKDREEVRVSRVAVVLGDIVGLGFFAFFFSLPFFICGAVQSVGCWGFPALFLWPFALVGVWLMKLNAKYGSLTIQFIPGGFHLHSLSFDEDILYDQLEKVTPAVLKNPRWLRVLTGLAALFSQGADQARMTGQYLLTSSASYGGLHFRFRDGRAFYLWCQDQWGRLIFKGLPRLLEQIKAAGLLDESKPMEKKGFATDIVTRSSGKRGARGKDRRRVRPMLFLAGTPLYVLIAFLLLGKGLVARDDALLAQAASAAKPVKKASKMVPRSKPSMPPLKDDDIAWRKTVGGAQIVMGEYVIQTGDGGFLVAGESFKGRSDILLVRMDRRGNILWKKTYGDVGEEKPAGLAEMGDGSYIIVGTQGPSLYRNVYFLKVDATGKVLWVRTWGGKYTDEMAEAMALRKDGTLAVIVDIKYRPTLVTFSPKGHMLSRNRLTTGQPDGRKLSARGLLVLSDGSLMICGVLERTGAGFQDAFLMKLGPKGNLTWAKTYGGAGKEGVNALRRMPDGGYLMTGFKGFSGAGAQKTWLIRTDAKGNVLWNKVLKSPGDDKGRQITALPGGASVILGPNALRKIDARGKILWQRWLGRERHIYGLVSDNAGDVVMTGRKPVGNGNVFKSELIAMKIHIN